MGIADLIPGVSGGTIALITGIYNELINSINLISWKSILILKTKGFSEFLKFINGRFLIPVFFGVFISLLSLARFLEFLIKSETVSLWSFFFGLTLSSFIYLIKKIKAFNKSHFTLTIIGVLISFFITLNISSNPNSSHMYLFFCGFIAITAMILPGISGAYILLILGVYKTVVSSIKNLQDLLFNFEINLFYEVTGILFFFGSGCITGLKVTSKTISMILKKYPNNALSFLTGLMIGAIHKIWPWQNNVFNNLANKKKILVMPYNYDYSPEIIKAIFFMVLGGLTLLFLTRLKESKSG